MVDARLARSLVQRAISGLKSTEPQSSTDPHDPIYAQVAAATPRRRGGRAQDVLDPETYHTIKTECPGWDLDSNPDEMPRNYSKRFLGFMRKHHERNKYSLPGF